MKNKFTKNSNDEPFTIVYFDVMKDLRIDFTEYLVLQTMLHFSDRNQYKQGVTKLSKYLKKSRTTIIEVLKVLSQKEHINRCESEIKVYNLNCDIRERFDFHNELYVKINHKHRKELKLNETHYVFLYMVYTLSKNNKNRIAIASKAYYCKYINTSESNFATMKCELIKKGYLERQNNSFLKLNDKEFNSFENFNNVQ